MIDPRDLYNRGHDDAKRGIMPCNASASYMAGYRDGLGCGCDSTPDSFTVTISGETESCWCDELREACEAVLRKHGVSGAVNVEVRV